MHYDVGGIEFLARLLAASAALVALYVVVPIYYVASSFVAVLAGLAAFRRSPDWWRTRTHGMYLISPMAGDAYAWIRTGVV